MFVILFNIAGQLTFLNFHFQSIRVLYVVLASYGNVEYSKLSQEERKPLRPKKWKSKVFDMIPKYKRQSSKNNESSRNRAGNSGDKEYLLLDDYNTASPEQFDEIDISSDNEVSDHLIESSEESGNSTDVDVVVEEYKEKLNVGVTNDKLV